MIEGQVGDDIGMNGSHKLPLKSGFRGNSNGVVYDYCVAVSEKNWKSREKKRVAVADRERHSTQHCHSDRFLIDFLFLLFSDG